MDPFLFESGISLSTLQEDDGLNYTESDYIDPWFLEYHPLHEFQENVNNNNLSQPLRDAKDSRPNSNSNNDKMSNYYDYLHINTEKEKDFKRNNTTNNNTETLAMGLRKGNDRVSIDNKTNSKSSNNKKEIENIKDMKEIRSRMNISNSGTKRNDEPSKDMETRLAEFRARKASAPTKTKLATTLSAATSISTTSANSSSSSGSGSSSSGSSSSSSSSSSNSSSGNSSSSSRQSRVSTATKTTSSSVSASTLSTRSVRASSRVSNPAASTASTTSTSTAATRQSSRSKNVSDVAAVNATTKRSGSSHSTSNSSSSASITRVTQNKLSKPSVVTNPNPISRAISGSSMNEVSESRIANKDLDKSLHVAAASSLTATSISSVHSASAPRETNEVKKITPGKYVDVEIVRDGGTAMVMEEKQINQDTTSNNSITSQKNKYVYTRISGIEKEKLEKEIEEQRKASRREPKDNTNNDRTASSTINSDVPVPMPIISETITSIHDSINTSKPSGAATDEDMLNLLKQHNSRFMQPSAYEPPRHSVRDVRKWERRTGKVWAKLGPQEREVANNEIDIMKRSVFIS